MQNNKISAHPLNKERIAEFISGAEQKKTKHDNVHKNQADDIYPWNNPSIRDDVQKVFTVKLPEALILKIKYISEQTNKSQQRIIREIISEEINKIIAQMTLRGSREI